MVKKHSAESKLKMRIKKLGKKSSPETILKIQLSNRKRRKNLGQKCQTCGSTYIIRRGFQNNKQMLQCRDCNKYWSIERSAVKDKEGEVIG